MSLIPLMVDLNKKNIVIVGGGKVAERRVNVFLDSGASITVISPEVKEGIRSLWRKGKLIWKQKYFEADDLNNAYFIISATNDAAVNKFVIAAASEKSLVNAAGNASMGNVQVPSFLKQGELTVSVSTNGASPMLAAKIKQQLQQVYDEHYEGYLDFLHESRKLIKQTPFSENVQTILLKELLSEIFLNVSQQQKTITWLQELGDRGDTE